MGGLPWEILFDDKGFLVTRSIVPIRVVGGFDVGEIVMGEAIAAKNLCLKALKICPEIEKETYAEIIHSLAIIYESSGDLKEALRLSQQSIDIRIEIGNRIGEGISLHLRSRIYQKLG
jgi:tetratricopeptide (TPR) repeat protein